MADNADIAADELATVLDAAVSQARAPLPAGSAGECHQCEWWMPRLVDGLCGFCRDGRPRPPDWEPPTPPSSTPETAPQPKKEIIMPGKTIELPATATAAIDAVTQHAAANCISQGKAAASLIERGIAAAVAASTPPAPLDLREIAIEELLGEVASRVQGAASATVVQQLTERAEAAESKLAGLRQLLV